VFEQRRGPTGGLGLALIRDGNGTRSFETLLRYRGGALAEFWRALKTLKALQAEQAAMALQEAVPAPLQSIRPTARPPFARRPQPNEPERRPEAPPERRLEYILTDPPGRDVTLHDPAAPWRPNEPEARRDAASSAAPARALPISHDQPAPGRGAGVLVPWAEGSGAARREPGR
jgi:hypothetical protein